MRSRPQSTVVSVVMATYNRADVLRRSITSVIRQDYTDWELIVIGDHCTDHTVDVVESFNDPRVSFVNRTVNHGEQSVPNNDGIAMANGRFLAFLNHDDIWFRHHLSSCVQTLERTGADLVAGRTVTINPGKVAVFAAPDFVRRQKLYGFRPASSWVMKRSLPDDVGKWSCAFELHHPPSVDFLMRVLDSGADVLSLTESTLAVIPSGCRKESYTVASNAELEFADALLGDDPWHTIDELSAERVSGARRLRRRLFQPMKPLIAMMGQHPVAVNHRLRYPLQRRGDFIRQLRSTRGIAPNPTGVVS